jgi:hypothetical protein
MGPLLSKRTQPQSRRKERAGGLNGGASQRAAFCASKNAGEGPFPDYAAAPSGLQGRRLHELFSRGYGRQRDRLDLGEVELARRVVDIEADDLAVCIEIDNKTLDDFPRLGTCRNFSCKNGPL